MSSRGGEWFEVEGTGEIFWWPYCEIGGCPNFICRGRSDRFCWPHSKGDLTVPQMIQKFSCEKV